MPKLAATKFQAKAEKFLIRISRDKLEKIDAEIDELDSGNEESVSDERLEELEQAYEENRLVREHVEAALEKALDDASTVKTASPSKQVRD